MTRDGRVALVHGGLYEPSCGPVEWWERPGVAPALRTLGYDVHVLSRTPRPTSWDDEALHLAACLAADAAPVSAVAASNGCSAALRLAIDRPELVRQLVLCWPVTGDDPEVDRVQSSRLAAAGVDRAGVSRLLDGGLVRGITRDELASFDRPVLLVPSEPDDDRHQRRTVAALRRLMPRAVIGLGTPPSASPAFAPHLGALVSLLDVVLSD